MKKTKVLFVSHSCTWESYRGLPEELAKFDLDLTLLIPNSWIEKSNKKPKGYKLIEKKTFFAPHIYKFFFFPPLLLEMKKLNPDIIFLDEEPGSIIAFQGLIWSKLTGAKLCFRSCENIYRTRKFPFNSIENLVFRNSEYATVMNPEVKEILKQKQFKGKTEIIELGIDKKVFYRKNVDLLKKRLGTKGFVIGFVGRLSEEKNVELLLKAASKLDFEYTLLVDNLFVANYKKKLVLLSKKLKIHDRIIYFDSSFDNIADYINCLDVLVLPSKTTRAWKEQFGRVLIEAMACEIPVIGSSSGSIPWVIGDAGLIFNEKNEGQLIEKLNKIQKDKTLRKKLILKGINRVENNFLNSILAKKFYNFFKQIK